MISSSLSFSLHLSLSKTKAIPKVILGHHDTIWTPSGRLWQNGLGSCRRRRPIAGATVLLGKTKKKERGLAVRRR